MSRTRNKVLQEINGYHTDQKDEKPASPSCSPAFPTAKTTARPPAADGSIRASSPATIATAPATATPGTTRLQPDWAFAWPHNRRVMYNRASADPEGKPWSERKKLIWWDAEKKKWVGFDEPDFEPDKSPDYRPPPAPREWTPSPATQPFIMKPDGVAWLFAPAMKDGPFPTHYEPAESPVSPTCSIRSRTISPAVRYFEGPLNLIDHVPSKEYPIVACTFRVTEHYLSGPMSRFNSWLNELMPAMFVEISPGTGGGKGHRATAAGSRSASARGTIEARALVTRRLRPLQHRRARPSTRSAFRSTGDMPANASAMSPTIWSRITAEPNVSIQEDKAFAVRCVGRPNVRKQPEARPSRRRAGRR